VNLAGYEAEIDLVQRGMVAEDLDDAPRLERVASFVHCPSPAVLVDGPCFSPIPQAGAPHPSSLPTRGRETKEPGARSMRFRPLDGEGLRVGWSHKRGSTCQFSLSVAEALAAFVFTLRVVFGGVELGLGDDELFGFSAIGPEGGQG